MGNHRADRSADRAAGQVPGPRGPGSPAGAGGHRRAAGRRRARSARFPALPTLVGLAAMAVAGAGAVGLGHGQAPQSDQIRLSAGAGALTGTDAIGFTADRAQRAQAISRDSDRQAMQAAATQELQRAAEAQSRQRNAALTSLARSAQKRADQIAQNQWVLPTEGFHLTAGFGQTSGLWATFHTGLDFAAPTGTPIFAVAAGVITDTGWDGPYGYRTVETLHDGTEIWYAHQSAIDVHPGEEVNQGETIGAVGATGNTTGPHLHLEVRPTPDDPIDPFAALEHHGVTP